MSSVSDTTSPLSGHWVGKLRRRRAIIEAAYHIILKDGDAGLTMRRLALQAGVSPTTPYNLFGSKESVIRAVFDEDFANFERQYRAKAGANELARIFDVIDFSFDAFAERPNLYIALFRTLEGARESEVRSSEWLRTAFLTGIVEDAIAAGYVATRHKQLLAMTIVRIFRSVILEWVAAEISLGDAHRQVGAGIAMLLGSTVPQGHQAVLAELRTRYE
jgi:AcrR family transcriptional regulator